MPADLIIRDGQLIVKIVIIWLVITVSSPFFWFSINFTIIVLEIKYNEILNETINTFMIYVLFIGAYSTNI